MSLKGLGDPVNLLEELRGPGQGVAGGGGAGQRVQGEGLGLERRPVRELQAAPATVSG